MIYLLFLSLLTFIKLYPSEPINYVFCHGLGGNGIESVHYVQGHTLENVELKVEGKGIQQVDVNFNIKNSFYILYKPIHYFNHPCAHESYGAFYPDTKKVTINSGIPNPKKVSLGQDCEINALKQKLDTVKGDCILFGRSMGASTVINYMGIYKPNFVKAVVLEAPFDSVENWIKLKSSFFYWTGLGSLGRKFMYPAYSKKGPKPIDLIKDFPKDVPVIFIHSKNDMVVPIDCSRNLYRELLKSGHKKLHLFELEAVGHNDATIGRAVSYNPITQDFSDDSLNYQRVVHAFYKNYNLPHDDAFAIPGLKLLATTQPAI